MVSPIKEVQKINLQSTKVRHRPGAMQVGIPINKAAFRLFSFFGVVSEHLSERSELRSSQKKRKACGRSGYPPASLQACAEGYRRNNLKQALSEQLKKRSVCGRPGCSSPSLKACAEGYRRNKLKQTLPDLLSEKADFQHSNAVTRGKLRKFL